VDYAVTVSLYQSFDVAADALATKVAVRNQQGDAEQEQDDNGQSNENTRPPPTH
jgi:hypothetical protein